MPDAPTLRLERTLLRGGASRVAGVDEVGRGALAGPVSVGVVVVSDPGPVPTGLRDSKLLSPAAREALVPAILAWADASAVGHASPQEIDRWGITAALRLAAERALATIWPPPDIAILDGHHDWLRRASRVAASPTVQADYDVRTKVKADLTCASVAAASVLAKVERDAIMSALARSFPAYGWDENRGYASAGHRDAIVASGPCEHHRQTWRLVPDGEQVELWGATDPAADGERIA